MSSLPLLHAALRSGIVNDLGWRSLRPVQDLAIPPLLAGANAVILAPTAGGKTEAAIFPVLSRILTDALSPVAALYICPIRALLNNQEDRLRRYAQLVGLDVFKWHGDVSESRREDFRRRPTHVLLTTPESLEVMFISERTDTEKLFASLSTVIIDEVHAFAGDDRGAHLSSLLERLTRLAGRDLQRIGLSATVGNPDAIATWLQGSSRREKVLITPPRPVPQRELHIEHCDDVDDAARGIAQVARHQKSLVFVESRATAEKALQALQGRGVEVFIHHSSVSREDRALAEERFTNGENTAIVATSTLELGIDIGDLDQVLQLDAPATVAAFLQRLGRTGRREGKPQRCTFFCQGGESVLRAAAVLRLAQAGWVEPVVPPDDALHVLAHQVMAMVLQEQGLSRTRLFSWLEGAYAFSGLSAPQRRELVETMLERDILHEDQGVLSLGREGERRYGRKNFFDLYAVFDAPAAMRVVHGTEEVGFLQASFVSMHEEEALCFRLAGRAWEVTLVDFERGVLQVMPARAGRVPSWLGAAGVLSRALCEAMRDVLRDEGAEAAWLSPSARKVLEVQRAHFAPLFEQGLRPLEELEDGGVQWHTFAGGAVNRVLAVELKAKTGVGWVAGNLSVRAKGVTAIAAREAASALRHLDWDELAGTQPRRETKFEPCLPQTT